jgi:transcriptional regulator with XRE-family HTH domain
MVFETKKIKSETLSEYLIEIREGLHLSVEEVSLKSGVPVKFLEALESGKYHHLPATVYVLGFLKKLAEEYSVQNADLVEQFKKERAIEEQVNSAGYKNIALNKKFGSNFILTPKILSFGFGMLLVLFTVAYVVWQVFSINKTPSLEISQPVDRQIVRDSYVNVIGKTDPGIMVVINDQNIFVDEKGNFKSQIGVGNGPKDLVFIAKNKFDNSISKTITVIGDAQVSTSTSGSSEPAVKPVILEIQCIGPVTLSLAVDNQKAQNTDCDKGSSLTYTADNVIYLSTTDGGATKVVFNGKDLGVLGRSHEALKNVPFFMQDTVAK